MSIFSLGPRPHLCIHVVGGWLAAPAGVWTRALRSTDWGKLCWSWSFIPACSTQQHSHHPSPVTHLHISTSAGVPDQGWRHVTNGGSPREKITITDTLPLPLPLLYPLIIRLRREGGKGVKIKNSDACKRFKLIYWTWKISSLGDVLWWDG